MNKGNILFGVVGLFTGLLISFILTNALHSNDREAVVTNVSSSSGAPPTSGTEAASPSTAPSESLSDEEIRGAIAKTDARKDEPALQRNFGLALYQYVTQTRDKRYLPDVARFLKRAFDNDPKDHDLIVSLGNVHFDIGQSSDPAGFIEARKYYQKALELKPDDADVRTDLGLTYYFAKPSDPQRAITEYRKALALDPRHERTLQSLASALISTGKQAEAEKRIDELQSVNPSNPSLPNLRAQLAQSRNAAQE